MRIRIGTTLGSALIAGAVAAAAGATFVAALNAPDTWATQCVRTGGHVIDRHPAHGDLCVTPHGTVTGWRTR